MLYVVFLFYCVSFCLIVVNFHFMLYFCLLLFGFYGVCRRLLNGCLLFGLIDSC